MKALRHIGVGFLVSFLGSLPLGYLNVVGLEICKTGIEPVIWFVLGVISVEIFVIYFTLVFAHFLMRKTKLMKFIEGFSVIFMFALAFIFYGSGKDDSADSISKIPDYPFYVLGVVLSCVNFLQLPFWTGWNLYLLNKKHIDANGNSKYCYVLGTAAGTFAGMMAFILSVNELALMFLTVGIMDLIALVFVILGIVQAVKFYRKYYAAKKQ